jgi:hypothetical protein
MKKAEGGHAMSQSVSWFLALTVEGQVQSQASQCGICRAQSGNARGYTLSASVFPNSIIPTMLHI